jgi:hypothetical protein
MSGYGVDIMHLARYKGLAITASVVINGGKTLSNCSKSKLQFRENDSAYSLQMMKYKMVFISTHVTVKIQIMNGNSIS